MSSPSTRRADACPLCGAPAAPAHRPFCGQGCRDRDLLRWLGDGYAIPGRSAAGRGDFDGGALDSDEDAPL